jgi:hypothetical protein
MDRRARIPESATFTQALTPLKRRGSNLLLVGPGYEDAHLSASRRLLGDDDGDGPPRRRLLVLTDGQEARERRLSDVDRTTVRTLGTEWLTRGGGAVTDHADADGTSTVPAGSADTPTLAGLADAVTDAVADLDREAGGLEPAQLRVCPDSLVPLVESFGEREVFTFLHVLTGELRGAGAMAR